jgi:hypothetical protein
MAPDERAGPRFSRAVTVAEAADGAVNRHDADAGRIDLRLTPPRDAHLSVT